MRGGGRALGVAIITMMLALPVACGDDGNGPMGSGNGDGDGNGFDVSGTWRVTATVIESSCDGVEVGDQETDQVVIEHEGAAITFIIEDQGSVTGAIDVETGNFEIDVMVTDPILGSLRVQESGTFTSETSYTSEEIITLQDPDLACQVRTMDQGTRTSTSI